ncbi:MAG: hypothetical protein I3275_03305 [Candidatus Moeniiplasma glomeromycotorum]|nr:hypothetical protein [Candidatus Moeniiplasma glomeromycotorum]
MLLQQCCLNQGRIWEIYWTQETKKIRKNSRNERNWKSSEYYQKLNQNLWKWKMESNLRTDS